jgi:hypothetical protein|nr:hypothetical protein [uncultured Lachnoanaerobaculum sp.]
MANRPIFIATDTFPFYNQKSVEFRYYSGFSISQKQKSIISLHEAYKEQYCNSNILEISTKSTDELGVKLSAFNLSATINNRSYTLECIFQGSKVFEHGGPYTEIYTMEPWEAKKYGKLKSSGNILEFNLFGTIFRREPKDFFYNWIYINALYTHKEYLDALTEYEAFTDIEFNPKKSINCQARSVAIAVGLNKAGMLDECVSDQEKFLNIIYNTNKDVKYEQMTFFKQ